MKYTFPKNFIWGTASSGPQSEGTFDGDGRAPSIWDRWYAQEPDRFHNRVSPELTSDFYHRYGEEFALMQDMGLTGFRTSIQWSRILPDPYGKPNPVAVKYYNNMLDAQIGAGVEPSIDLFHFDMPTVLQDKGGFENRDEFLPVWEKYVSTCFDLFDGKVAHWFTFNEPIVPVEAGYLYDMHPPHVVDFRRAGTVAYHTMLAHATAVKAFNAKPRKSTIGIILNLTPSYPRSQNPADIKAGRIADLFFNKSFLDPALLGQYPEELVELLKSHNQLPECREGDKELLMAGIVKRIGVNFYCPRRVKAKEYAKHPDAPFFAEDFFDLYEMPGRRMNPYRGWEIYPKGVYDILTSLREDYGNPTCIVSENGMGVENEARFRNAEGFIEDTYRIDFIREHLSFVHKAIAEGSACEGYFLWTFSDNWSWMNAYKNRYGFVEVDLENDLKRIPKRSARWIKEVTKANGFDV